MVLLSHSSSKSVRACHSCQLQVSCAACRSAPELAAAAGSAKSVELWSEH